MTKTLYGIIIEDNRVLLVNEGESNKDFWSIPKVESSEISDLLSSLSEEFPNLSFEKSNVHPYVSYPFYDASSFIITNYSRKDDSTIKRPSLWIHAYLSELSYEPLTARIIFDLDKHNHIRGQNHYHVSDF